MTEEKTTNDIIEPIWYLKELSIESERSERSIWELITPLILPIVIIIAIMSIPSNFIDSQITRGISFAIFFPLIILFFIISRKYFVEKNLDIDRYFWVSYFSGVIGKDLLRLSELSTYRHYIEISGYQLRRWLYWVAFDYRGDKSGKRKIILELRKRIKSLTKYVEENKTDSKKLSELGNKFFELGNEIYLCNPETRIQAKYLQQITKILPEGKPEVLELAKKFVTYKVTIAGICIFISIITGYVCFHFLGFNLLNSIIVIIGMLPALASIYSILSK